MGRAKTSACLGRKHANLHDLGKRFMWRCHYCGKITHCPACQPRQPEGLAATRDHYIPKSEGGRNRGANIVLACWLCNQEKADAVPSDRRGARC